MTIKVNCPNCDEPHRLADDKGGKVIRCNYCDERIDVPYPRDDRPARSRMRSRRSSGPVLLILGIVGGLLLLLLVGGGLLIGIAAYRAARAVNQVVASVSNPGGPGNPLFGRDPTDVNEAIQWLGQGGSRAESAAAWLDRQPRNPALAPQVVAAIDRHYTSATVNDFARQTFLNAMATWSGPNDVPVLVRSLDHAFNDKVLDALVRYKNEEAARGVARKLGGLTFFKASATLKRMGPVAEDAVADLMLTTPDGTAKHEAAKLLETIGTRKSVAKMRQAMARDGALEYQGNRTIAAIQNR